MPYISSPVDGPLRATANKPLQTWVCCGGTGNLAEFELGKMGFEETDLVFIAVVISAFLVPFVVDGELTLRWGDLSLIS
jgi:hypothetical protein